MKRRDGFDLLQRGVAFFGDAVAVFGGLLLAAWLRFDSGWLPLTHEAPPTALYWHAAMVVTVMALLVFASLGLYRRPQTGTFADQVPRLLRAIVWSLGLAIVLAFMIRTDPPFSRLAAGLALLTVPALVLFQRWFLFKAELALARRRKPTETVLILGADDHAIHLREALEGDPRLRCKVIGFLVLDNETCDERIEAHQLAGTVSEFQLALDRLAPDQVVLSRMDIGHERLIALIVACERAMVRFHVVPDLFGILASKVEIRHLNGIPLLGVGQGPLDQPFNRLLKRLEDLAGAVAGLLLSAPVIAVLAMLIKRSSPGPVFYRQQRCGWRGKPFTIIKLRTMRADAETESGPVWSCHQDPRRTSLGAWLRRYNLDELPQFWNVLKGDMSLVGPRPERPEFVEQFRDEIGGYMWRHSCLPGMTGWAQVNGLRGQTSLTERIRHDLWYLENWSLALDFKILLRTLLARGDPG
jgi:exopolysaccharide biosynthesis polyprenyl glycosylphosphotransferase